jgi:hypothetical protein
LAAGGAVVSNVVSQAAVAPKAVVEKKPKKKATPKTAQPILMVQAPTTIATAKRPERMHAETWFGHIGETERDLPLETALPTLIVTSFPAVKRNRSSGGPKTLLEQAQSKGWVTEMNHGRKRLLKGGMEVTTLAPTVVVICECYDDWQLAKSVFKGSAPPYTMGSQDSKGNASLRYLHVSGPAMVHQKVQTQMKRQRRRRERRESERER